MPSSQKPEDLYLRGILRGAPRPERRILAALGPVWTRVLGDFCLGRHFLPGSENGPARQGGGGFAACSGADQADRQTEKGRPSHRTGGPFDQMFGDPSRIRTCDRSLRRRVLYPAELWGRIGSAIRTGRCADGRCGSYPRSSWGSRGVPAIRRHRRPTPSWRQRPRRLPWSGT